MSAIATAQPATREDIEMLTAMVEERAAATTIYPDDDLFFATRCDEILPRVLRLLTDLQGVS